MNDAPGVLMVAMGLVLAIGTCAELFAQDVTGVIGAHDPSSVVREDFTYHYFATGPGIISRISGNAQSWSAGPAVFTTPPAWTTGAVPSFDGFFWAPDVAYFNGKYHLYYSVSSWGTIDSAIGLATTPSLANPTWTDHGKVVQSDAVWEAGPNTDTTGFNAIDPSVLTDSDGRVWMTFGSYSSGILVTELDPITGKRLNPSALDATLVANNAAGGGWGSSIEAASIMRGDNYYYLFVNYGGCCAGVDSTYDIRVGRSASPTGPFLDKNGVNMTQGGGSLFLDDTGRFIAPGHFEHFNKGPLNYFSYHYYNGDANGAPTFGNRPIQWTLDNWPTTGTEWTGAASDNWGTASNWSNNPPNVGSATNLVNFGPNSAGNYVITLGSSQSAGVVNFSGTTGYTIGTNTLHELAMVGRAESPSGINVSEGSHTIAAPLEGMGEVNVATNSRLTIAGGVEDASVSKYGYGTLALNGNSDFIGPVAVKLGTIEVNGSVTAPSVNIGQTLGKNASIVVRGNGSLSTTSDLMLGDTRNGTDVASGTLVIQDNANVTVNGFVRVGLAGSGTVDQIRGVFSTSGNILIGQNAGAAGTWNMSNGTLNQTNAVRSIFVGANGAGTLNVNGTSQVIAAGGLRLGSASGSMGTVNLNSGTITTPNVTRGTGGAVFNFNGGTLRSSAASTTFLQGVPTYVQAGGATIDTQSFNVTLAQPLLHDAALGGAIDGGLTKTGLGTLDLNSNHTYTGPTVVRGGTLRVLGGSVGVSTPVGLPDVNIELAPANPDGGTLVVSGGTVHADRVIIAGNAANTAGGVATLTQTGGVVNASLWLAVGSYGKGTLNMTGGTLNQNSSGASQLEVAVFGIEHSTANIGGRPQVNILNNGNFSIGVVNNSGSGTVNQNGGAVTFFSDSGSSVGGSGNVILGQFSPTGTYTYNLNGGTLTTGAVLRNAAGATANFNFNGGLLRAARDGANLVSNLTSAQVQQGGAAFDTNGLAVSLSQPLLHEAALGGMPDGGLTKYGTGTLTLTGANTYSGDTHVEAGMLAVNYAYLNDTADIYLASGASFGLNFSGVDEVGAMFIDGAPVSAGTYGAPGSGAATELAVFLGSGRLRVTQLGLVGDYNNDGTINAADYTVWRNRRGSAAALANDVTPGVGADDYIRWKANYGRTAGSGASAAIDGTVPEPTAVVLFLLGVVLQVFARACSVNCPRQEPQG